MAEWRLAKGLIKLREQINQRWPQRSKLSDGSIGDTAHSARVSDHNPSNGIVHAIDITHDPEHGVDGGLLAQALTTDPRIKYVIFAGRIYKARTGQWEAYHGPNRHDHHVHVSITDAGADDERTWALDTNIPPQSYPVLKRGARGLAVRVLQEKLNVTTDGIFGPATEAKVQLFQRAHGLPDDGIVNEQVWSALLAP